MIKGEKMKTNTSKSILLALLSLGTAAYFTLATGCGKDQKHVELDPIGITQPHIPYEYPENQTTPINEVYTEGITRPVDVNDIQTYEPNSDPGVFFSTNQTYSNSPDELVQGLNVTVDDIYQVCLGKNQFSNSYKENPELRDEFYNMLAQNIVRATCGTGCLSNQEYAQAATATVDAMINQLVGNDGVRLVGELDEYGSSFCYGTFVDEDGEEHAALVYHLDDGAGNQGYKLTVDDKETFPSEVDPITGLTFQEEYMNGVSDVVQALMNLRYSSPVTDTTYPGDVTDETFPNGTTDTTEDPHANDDPLAGLNLGE